jgi:hypothetical protein
VPASLNTPAPAHHGDGDVPVEIVGALAGGPKAIDRRHAALTICAPDPGGFTSNSDVRTSASWLDLLGTSADLPGFRR